MEPLLESLGVVLLIGEVVVCSKVMIECQLVLYKYVLKVYFVVFNLLGLDIILEMDWFSQHYACINCYNQIDSF